LYGYDFWGRNWSVMVLPAKIPGAKVAANCTSPTLSRQNPDARGWWFEDHVHITTTTPWAHEAAPKPAEREAETFGPNKCLHVQFGLEVASLEPRWRLHGTAKAAGADAPTEPVGLPEGLD